MISIVNDTSLLSFAWENSRLSLDEIRLPANNGSGGISNRNFTISVSKSLKL